MSPFGRWRISPMKLAVILVLIIEAVMIFYVIVLDKEESTGPDGRIRVTFWHAMGGRLGGVMKTMVKKYNDLPDNPYWINAQYMGRYESLRQKLIASLISGTAPHCAQVYESWLAKMIKGNAIYPLDDLVALEGKEFMDDLVPVMRRNIMFKGRVWSMPFNKSMPILYYNKDMFREVGLDPDHFPATWDEFLAACFKLTRDLDDDGINDTWGFSFAPAPWMHECLVFQAGGEMLDKEGTRVMLDSKASLDALGFMMDLIYKHKVAYLTQGYEGQSDYVAQKVGMVQGSSVSKIYLQDQINFDWGMAPLPGRDRKAAVLSGTNVALFKGHPEKELLGAWDFIKWFTSTEQTAFWSENTTYMPVRLSAIKLLDDYLAQPLSTKPAIDQLAWAEFEPRIAAWFKCRDILAKTIEKAMILKGKPEDYLVPMTEEMNKILYYDK